MTNDCGDQGVNHVSSLRSHEFYHLLNIIYQKSEKFMIKLALKAIAPRLTKGKFETQEMYFVLRCRVRRSYC